MTSKSIERMVTEKTSSVSPKPYIHNHVITQLDDSRAQGRCYVELRDAAKEYAWMGTAGYDDEYIKTGGEWKFLSRQLTLFRVVKSDE